MEDSLRIKCRGRPKRITEETIKKDLDSNGLSINIVYDRAQ